MDEEVEQHVSEVQETEVVEVNESCAEIKNVDENGTTLDDAEVTGKEELEESAPAETQQTLEEVEDFWATCDGGDASLTRTTTTTTSETVYEEVIATSEEEVHADSEDVPIASDDVAANQAYETASNELDDQYSVTSPPSEATVVEVEAEDSQVMEPVEDFWGSS